MKQTKENYMNKGLNKIKEENLTYKKLEINYQGIGGLKWLM